MKKLIWPLAAVLMLVALWPRQREVKPDWAGYRDAVVEFSVVKSTVIFGKKIDYGWTGSGFLVSEDGYIVTAAHVVDGAEDQEIHIKVWGAPGYEVKHRIIYVNGTDDIAVLKVDVPGYKLPYLKLGDGDDLRVGDELYVVGHPMGLTWTAVETKLAAKRFIQQTLVPEGNGEIESYVFQLMAPIAGGTSGGPVINNKGQVVGLIHTSYTAKSQAQITFAVPVQKIRWVMESLGLR